MGLERSAARLVKADIRARAADERYEVHAADDSVFGKARALGIMAILFVQGVRFDLAKESFGLKVAGHEDGLRAFNPVDQAREILGLSGVQLEKIQSVPGNPDVC